MTRCALAVILAAGLPALAACAGKQPMAVDLSDACVFKPMGREALTIAQRMPMGQFTINSLTVPAIKVQATRFSPDRKSEDRCSGRSR